MRLKKLQTQACVCQLNWDSIRIQRNPPIICAIVFSYSATILLRKEEKQSSLTHLSVCRYCSWNRSSPFIIKTNLLSFWWVDEVCVHPVSGVIVLFTSCYTSSTAHEQPDLAVLRTDWPCALRLWAPPYTQANEANGGGFVLSTLSCTSWTHTHPPAVRGQSFCPSLWTTVTADLCW